MTETGSKFLSFADLMSAIGAFMFRWSSMEQALSSSLDGAREALLGIKIAPAPSFEIYEGDKATTEAMRRFFTTFIGWINPAVIGKGISGWNEILAFILCLLVDIFLLCATYYRGRKNPDGMPRAKLHQAQLEIARRHDGRRARELLDLEDAYAHASAMTVLANHEILPFADVLVEVAGTNYLIIPANAPDRQYGEMAYAMLSVLRRVGS